MWTTLRDVRTRGCRWACLTEIGFQIVGVAIETSSVPEDSLNRFEEFVQESRVTLMADETTRESTRPLR